MAGGQLIFYGLAWPSARIKLMVEAGPPRASERTKPSLGTLARAFEDLRGKPAGTGLRELGQSFENFRGKAFGSVSEDSAPSRPLMLEARGGQGRPWQADSPEAFWRDFAGLSFYSDNGLEAFVRRRGDPEGLLDRPGATADSGRWLTPLHNGLRRFAACWSDADKNGVSHCSGDSHDAAEYWQLYLFPAIKAQIEGVTAPEGGPGVVLRALNLGAFMALSAASALERRIQMKRCRKCNSWFELARKDMQFCSATCRAAFANQQKREG